MRIGFEDTICAPATIAGTGAVSIIRLSGPDSLKIADKLVACIKGTIEETPGYRLKFGKIYSPDGSLLDEVLVSVFHAPHSYTGEDSVEISCHASSYIVDAVLQQMISLGARMATPGEFTQRAFVNGKMDLTQAEAVADVISAQDAAAHRVAMNQLKGGFSSELRELRAELLKIVSLMELELDFSEEEVEFADRKALLELVEGSLAHIQSLIESFRLGNAIKNGIPVAIVGAANAGKSTLLNALLGEERAIVSEIAGTTRDTIEECLNIGGHRFRFIDTAGIRETSEKIEKIGIERSFRSMRKANVILGLFDAAQAVEDLEASCTLLLENIDPESQTFIPILNKIDLVDTTDIDFVHLKDCINKIVNTYNSKVKTADYGEFGRLIELSAANGEGLSVLKQILSDYASRIDASSDSTLITNLRHLEALKAAHQSLARVREGLTSSIPSDLIAQDIREAIYNIGTIVGEISTDEVLGNIFSKFCIGK